MQLLAITGGVFVARILGPEPVGIFGIAVFVINVATIVTDAGMRTALIQHAAPLTERQLTTAFTLMLGLVTVVFVALLAGAPALTRIYPDAPIELTWLIRLIAVDLYLRAWRTLCEVRLERRLLYRELALADLAGSGAYHLVAVALVVSGSGVEALGWALVVGNLIRTGWLYRSAPWPMRFGLHGPTARALLRAGAPLQVNRIVDAAPGWITPTLVASLLGPEAVGLLVWSSTLGRKPLEVLENVVRVALPQFARLQGDIEEVEQVLRRYAVTSLLFCGLWFSVLAVAGHDLVRFVYTEQWLPAMPALILFAGVAMLASVQWLANAAVIAVGRGRFAAKVGTVAAVIAVGASALLVLEFGIVGVPLGQLAGIALATPWLLVGLHPRATSQVVRATLPVLVPVAGAIAAGSLVLLAPLAATPRGLLSGATVALVYLGVAWAVAAPWLRAAIREEVAGPRAWPRSPAP
jgi:O-antigen/teichoic acid export membrane protein